MDGVEIGIKNLYVIQKYYKSVRTIFFYGIKLDTAS
jgi:hypothetical protein